MGSEMCIRDSILLFPCLKPMPGETSEVATHHLGRFDAVDGLRQNVQIFGSRSSSTEHRDQTQDYSKHSLSIHDSLTFFVIISKDLDSCFRRNDKARFQS